MDVNYDLILAPRGQIFEYLRDTFDIWTCLGVPAIGSFRKKMTKKKILRNRLTIRPFPMRSFFFSIRFRLFSQSWTFTRAKPRSQPYASRNEFNYSPRGTQGKNPHVHWRSSNYCRVAKIGSKKSEVAPNSNNRSIFERWVPSDYCSSAYAPWAKTQTTPMEKRIFELGTSRRDCRLVPRSVWLISSEYRSKTNVNAEKVKIERDKT